MPLTLGDDPLEMFLAMITDVAIAAIATEHAARRNALRRDPRDGASFGMSPRGRFVTPGAA